MASPADLSTDSRRRRLVPAGVIVGGLAVLGVAQGVVWAQVAPGQQAKVFADGGYGPLPLADYHPFVALAIFVLAGLAVGLVAAFAAWRVRSIRGHRTLLALFVGASVGAAIAFAVGLALATGIDPATVGATGHELIVVAAPKLATPLVLVAEPAGAVVAYTFLAAWDGRADLGVRRAIEQLGAAGSDGKDASRPGGEDVSRTDGREVPRADGQITPEPGDEAVAGSSEHDDPGPQV